MRKIIIFVWVIMLVVLCCFGCTATTETKEVDFGRFTAYRQEMQGNPDTTILVDNETKVMYLYYQQGYGGGITVMVDEEGKPLIWED